MRSSGVSSVRMLRRIAHISSAASASSRLTSRRTQRSPQTAICSISGRSSSPARVSRYSPSRCSITPVASSVRRRLLSSDDDIVGAPFWISLKRRLPSRSSRRMIGVQRSVRISAAWAIGQNWP